MTGAPCAAADRAGACTDRLSVAARSSSRPSDRSRRRGPSRSSAACAEAASRPSTAEVGGARWRALRVTRPCCRPRRSRFRWQARGRSGRPTSIRVRHASRITDNKEGSIGSYLDEVLALCFCDKRLQLRGREGVDEPGLRHNEKEDLGASQDGQLVGLLQHRRR